MKRLIIKIISNRRSSKYFLNGILKLHNKIYDLISILVLVQENGTHPKRKIIRYDDWFLSHLSEQDVVLDIGCHEGALTSSLIKRAKIAYGIELDAKKIIRAKEKYSQPNLFFIADDATKFDYGILEPISIVTLSNVLEHIQERPEFLRKIITQVKWSGRPRFLIRVPTLERDWLTVYKKMRGIEYRLDRTHYIEHTVDEFREELRISGLNIESLEVRFGEIYCVCISA